MKTVDEAGDHSVTFDYFFSSFTCGGDQRPSGITFPFLVMQ